MSHDLHDRILDKLRDFVCHSIALDGTKDITNTGQEAVFTRGFMPTSRYGKKISLCVPTTVHQKRASVKFVKLF